MKRIASQEIGHKRRKQGQKILKLSVTIKKGRNLSGKSAAGDRRRSTRTISWRI